MSRFNKNLHVYHLSFSFLPPGSSLAGANPTSPLRLDVRSASFAEMIIQCQPYFLAIHPSPLNRTSYPDDCPQLLLEGRPCRARQHAAANLQLYAVLDWLATRPPRHHPQRPFPTAARRRAAPPRRHRLPPRPLCRPPLNPRPICSCFYRPFSCLLPVHWPSTSSGTTTSDPSPSAPPGRRSSPTPRPWSPTRSDVFRPGLHIPDPLSGRQRSYPPRTGPSRPTSGSQAGDRQPAPKDT